MLFLGALAWALASAQAPRISVIDFYGVRRVPPARLLQALGAGVGDPLPASKDDAEQRLAEVDGVVLASLEAVCCEDGGAILFVGIEETGAPHFDYRPPPRGAAVLPDGIVEAHNEYVERYQQAARTGGNAPAAEAPSNDPAVRSLRAKLMEFAADNTPLLRRVLEESSDSGHRAASSDLVEFAPDRQAAIDALQVALRDPEPAVRRSALRGLRILAEYAMAHPGEGLKIAPTWAVEMLNSVYWTDRARAAELLVTLTEARDRSTLEQIRKRALESVAEMAAWKSLPHALAAYILAGRLAGASEQEIRESWERGEREKILSLLPPAGKRNTGKR